MKLHFFKYQGTGNDFVLIDNRDRRIQLTTEQINFLCNRRFGIGADGLMMLESEPGYDFKMVYYNSDGNESSMCGNGGRCITAFAKYLGVIEEKAKFLAIDGAHEAYIKGDEVSLKMQDVKRVEVGSDFFFLDTGSPHYVKQVTHLNDLNLVEEGRAIRYNERFKEVGTNVNFIEKQEGALFVRTYERGVEDETLSCGTGVTAAALVAALTGLADTKNNCSIVTRGGRLNVKFDKALEHTFYNVWLEGAATFVFEGHITLSD
jgi:diaminopimelate epimerase